MCSRAAYVWGIARGPEELTFAMNIGEVVQQLEQHIGSEAYLTGDDEAPKVGRFVTPPARPRPRRRTPQRHE